MKCNDLVLYYHSNEGKEIVGVSEVIQEYYQDPTTDDDRWVVVELKPVNTLKNPVTLQKIKSDSKLSEIAWIKKSRLSVMPITKKE